jgi:hypothetical protein
MVYFFIPRLFPGEEVIISAVFQGYQVPVITARGVPLAKAGLMAGLWKAVLFAIPYDTRWRRGGLRSVEGVRHPMGRVRSPHRRR